ncbi:MAG: DUF502 domain-containing protein [Phycisphaeraceae bacterium]
MSDTSPRKMASPFAKFFGRGLGIVLPTALTFWLLFIAYNFVDTRIGQPINKGVRLAVLELSNFPKVTESEIQEHRRTIEAGQLDNAFPLQRKLREIESQSERKMRAWLQRETRRFELKQRWNEYALGLDLIGLVVAVILIYFIGLMITSFIGRRLYAKGEELIDRLPIVRRVYPSVKQVTDFFFGPKQAQMHFSNVVAVEYPRKGLWSVGLVTGETMRGIQDKMGQECLTVFIPSSPTPFTGYVITVPREETINLNITIEDAIKFAVSGGVLIPPSQRITPVSELGDPAVAPPPQGSQDSDPDRR